MTTSRGQHCVVWPALPLKITRGVAVVRLSHLYANTRACIWSHCLWMNERRALNGKFHTVWLNPSYMQWLCNTVAAGELCVSHLRRFHSTEQKHQPHKAAPLCGIYVDAQTVSLESKCRDETLVFEDNPQSYWDFLYPDKHLYIL